ncbi:MAG: RibD family protein [Pseudomonadota bacterium]
MSAAPSLAPSVTLKLATSLDGKIALANGRSKWITGAESRARVQELRAGHDVVLTGIGTVLADDPSLTARAGEALLARQPIRAVLDTQLRVPTNAALLSGEGGAVLIFTAHPDAACVQALEMAGAEVISCDTDESGRVSLPCVLQALHARGAASIMIEAGGRVAASALTAGVVDRVEWFRAPLVLGGDAQDVFSALGLDDLARAPIFVREGAEDCGADLHERYRVERATS